MGDGLVLFVGAPVAYMCMNGNKGWSGGLMLGLNNGLFYRIQVIAVFNLLNVPAVGPESIRTPRSPGGRSVEPAGPRGLVSGSGGGCGSSRAPDIAKPLVLGQAGRIRGDAQGG